MTGNEPNRSNESEQPKGALSFQFNQQPTQMGSAPSIMGFGQPPIPAVMPTSTPATTNTMDFNFGTTPSDSFTFQPANFNAGTAQAQNSGPRKFSVPATRRRK
jgi:hypothetical protein